MFDLTDKVALVTGSTRGIGKAIAEQMASQGAKVVVSSRKSDICDEVAQSINQRVEGSAGEAVAIPCNISHKAQLEKLVSETRKHYGRVDSLVCNAAVNPYFGPSSDMPDSALDKILDVNIKSNHWLCHMVLPEMVERQDGSIIVVSSIGGLHGSEALGAYGISKAADMALVRNLAVEYGPENIRVNAIAPGLVKTDFARALWENPDILKEATSTTPMRRIGQPEEIAGAAVFMASDAGRYMCGHTMVIDGGVTIA